MPMPKPGSEDYDRMIDFMRKDLQSGMGYSKIIMSVRKRMKSEGRDFDKEFEAWKQSKK